MRRLAVYCALIFTCVLAAVCNIVIQRLTGINVFSFSLWFVIPAGAIFVGMFAASGGFLAGRYLNIVPNYADAALMIITAAFTMWLIYYLDYLTFVLPNGSKASDIVSFGKFLEILLTTTELRVGRAASKTGPVGDLGYWLALIQFVGFLVGGFSIFVFLKDALRCGTCNAYLRKLKTKTTADLTLDEAQGMIDYMRQDGFPAYEESIAWKSNRKLDRNDPKACFRFDLYGCSKCKQETILRHFMVMKKGEWIEIPEFGERRALDPDLSLRDSFERGR